MSGNEPTLMPSQCLTAGGPGHLASDVWEQGRTNSEMAVEHGDRLGEWQILTLGKCTFLLGWKQ